MKTEFIPYEQALELKELGFDEPCIAYYVGGEDRFIYDVYTVSNFNGRNLLIGKSIATPLFQQAFDWFREKYNLDSYVRRVSYRECKFEISYILQNDSEEEWKRYKKFKEYKETYEEARLECLKKLIEICKQEIMIETKDNAR